MSSISDAISNSDAQRSSDGVITARVIAVQDDIVKIQAQRDESGHLCTLTKNEVVYLCPDSKNSSGEYEKLKAEVLRVNGEFADAQVYESTQGVAIGDPVEQSGELLSVTLGPGLLGEVFDGLQYPLEKVSAKYGIFLPRGAVVDALDMHRKWSFIPMLKTGDPVKAGDAVGTVQEGHITHKIMVPFDLKDGYKIDWIKEGNFTHQQTVAQIKHQEGQKLDIKLSQNWPVRKPVSADLLKRGHSTREFPSKPVITTQRLIDTFYPIAMGGTACIPGPFGAGKTVLQNVISRHSSVDVVIVVACGERAGEVVETINEFPQMSDPKTGGTLMDRTVIICNTSSMPVAAREASVFTGITIGEYYRQMGANVLLIADSTSRWAQAMRETSGRLEEIPGEEGFPAYLESSIKGLYERAGLIKTNDGTFGSLTMIGTVSPAGGNFDEPVTQATLSTVKCFLGLSADRAYKRFYPAVDPLISWSRYLSQMHHWYEDNMGEGWIEKVEEMKSLLQAGDASLKMMQVTGEEGISIEDFLTYQKALFVDMVYLQQDAFDKVDASVSIERQKTLFNQMYDIVSHDYDMQDKKSIRDFFLGLTGLFKNLNYAEFQSKQYHALNQQIVDLLATQGKS